MRIALYQPDIPQNTGTILRLATCLGISVDLIKPAGFVMDSRHLRRAGMDYLNHTSLLQHQSWDTYTEQREKKTRIILLTTQAKISYVNFSYNFDDTLLVGSESEGVPNHVHNYVDKKIRIPMLPHMRSLNVAVAISMVLGEALRQTNQLPAMK